MSDPVCGDCGHRSDASDERGFIPSEKAKDLSPCCPACSIMSIHTVWNDCQGPFCDSVRWDKAAAEEVMKEYGRVAGVKVVPVRVIVEPEERWEQRAWEERERI